MQPAFCFDWRTRWNAKLIILCLTHRGRAYRQVKCLVWKTGQPGGNEPNLTTISDGGIMWELECFVPRRYKVIFSKQIGYPKIIFIFPQSFQLDANSPNTAIFRKIWVWFPAKRGPGKLSLYWLTTVWSGFRFTVWSNLPHPSKPTLGPP